jgi:hypothetical protein
VKVQILCTLGPSSLRPEVIARLDERGVDLFRVNLSHTPLEAVASTVELVRGCSKTPVCLDTEGAQVRCGGMAPDVVLEEGRTVRLTASGSIGTGEELSCSPPRPWTPCGPAAGSASTSAGRCCGSPRSAPRGPTRWWWRAVRSAPTRP